MTFRELEQFVKRMHISVDTPIVVNSYDGFLVEADSFAIDKVKIDESEKKKVCIVIE